MLDIVEERDCIKLTSIFVDELKVKLYFQKPALGS